MLAWKTKDSKYSEGSARYWWAPCVDCAVWRTVWPYVGHVNHSLSDLVRQNGYPPRTFPLLFMWGSMARGQPRGPDSKFFDEAWLDYVRSCPHGRVVEAPGDHWMMHENASFVNHAIEAWIDSLDDAAPAAPSAGPGGDPTRAAPEVVHESARNRSLFE